MIDQAKVPVVMCPGCKRPMNALVTEAGPNGLQTTTYRCDTCGTETDRIYKGDADSHSHV